MNKMSSNIVYHTDATMRCDQATAREQKHLLDLYNCCGVSTSDIHTYLYRWLYSSLVYSLV